MSDVSAAPARTNVTADVFIAAYKQAIADGLTNEQLAEKLGIKIGTLSVKLTDYRNRLRATGLNDEQVKTILPSLKRPTVSRTGSVDAVLAALVRDSLAPAPAPAEAEAPAETAEVA